MEYQMNIINGYPLAEIEGGLFLLDTGCPVTFAEPKIKEINMDGFSLRPMSATPSQLRQIELAVGMHINGVIGFDTVRKFGNVLCDKAKMTMTFGAEVRDGVVVPFKNDLHFNIKVNGKDARAFLDTGAPNMMADNHGLLDKSRYVGMVDEYSFSGLLKLEGYKGTAEFGGVRTELTMLKSGSDIMRDGSDVYFSPDVFAKEFYMINWDERKVIFK